MSSPGNSNPTAIIATVGVMVLATYIASSVLLSSGNQIADLFFYLMVAAGALAMASPKLGFVLLVLETAGLDLAKRLMIVGGTVQFVDLFAVLGMAPITVVAIAASLLFRGVTGSIKIDVADFHRFGAVLLITALVVFQAYVREHAGISGTLRELANTATYAFLLFIVPLMMPTPEAISKCIRGLLLLYIPVALYGVYQQVFGYLDFEVAYLSAGLSIEVKQLIMGRIRAFSTLNSPTSLSVVTMSLAGFAIALCSHRRRDIRGWVNPLIAALFVMIFVAGWAASSVRAGLLLLPVAVLGTIVFQRASFTAWFYMLSTAFFLLIVLTSTLIHRNLGSVTDFGIQIVGDSGYLADMVNINTYTDRLLGFSNVLMNPDAWKLFGWGDGETAKIHGFAAHDPISSAVLVYGVLPTLVGFVIIGRLLWALHRRIFSMRDRSLRSFAAAMLANGLGNMAVSVLSGNLLATFPVNFFFWLSMGFAISLRRADELLTAEQEEESAPATPVQPQRGAWRNPLPAHARFR
jgi:hypothetical protein